MKGMFEGIKVLDLSWVIVGPTVTKYLADQGATVIKVEKSDHPCILRSAPPYPDRISGINRSGYFAMFNANKLSLGLDFKHSEGKEILRKLIRWADVLVSSFAPGVMEKEGLSYEELRKTNPGLIYVTTSMTGNSGPYAHLAGFGFQLVGYAGIAEITGWPDRTPAPPYGPYTDTIAPRFITAALITALLRKRRTGEGVQIDLSQHEAALQFIAPLLLDFELNQKIKGREGNTHPQYCPHGVYPCKEEDSWIALAITSEEQWKSLQNTIDKKWVWNDKFYTFAQRKKNEEELNNLISCWSAGYTSADVMSLLQDKKIPCGMVKNPHELVEDPQLSHRSAFWELDHEVVGKHLALGQPFILSNCPYAPPKPSPKLGEHTIYVCHDILGMSDKEIATLLGKEVLQVT